MSYEAVQRAITKAAELWANDLRAAQEDMVDQIAALLQERVARAAIVTQLAEQDTADFLLNELRLRNTIDQILEVYEDGVLANMASFGAISEASLEALVRVDEATYLTQVQRVAGEMKSALVQRVLGGASAAQMLAAVRALPSVTQAQTLVTTTMNVFSNSVTAVMAEGAPADQKYRYEGPADDDTRPICLEMIQAGDLTRDEIEDRFPGSFIDGGGFNCRHGWRPVESVDRNLKSNAAKLIEQKRADGKWRTPKTVLELEQERDRAA